MDIATYILCQSYVRSSLDGLGALKGAPCTIKSIEEVEGGNKVTFEWTGESGTKQTRTMIVKDGEAGVSIVSASINAQGHLIFVLSDGSTIDGGVVTGEAKLKQALTATVEIGTVTNGKTYAANTDIETIIRDILIKYSPPAITLNTSPATKLYDIVTDSISTILLKAVVTKKTNPVTKVSFYVGDTLLNEITTGVANGGTFQYQYTPATPIKSDVTFKAVATDNKQANTSTYLIKFVGKSYYGICDASVSDPDETVIKSGSTILKDTKAYTYSGINMEYAKVFYAFPRSIGESLSKIYDPVNNLQYLSDFQKSIQTVDGLEYVVYCQKQPSRSVDVTLQFS